MTLAIRRLSRQEADQYFEQVQIPSSDLLLDMAQAIVRKRNSLRTRTLVAHLRAWGASEQIQPWSGPEVDEMAMTRALALLALEAESRPTVSPLERAAWARVRLAKLLAESSAATEEAKSLLASRVAGAVA